MNSLLITTAAKFLLPGILLFSLFLLFRGHNQPGGGFAGGLVAASAFALYGLAFGRSEVLKLFKIHPIRLMGFGLILSVLSGFFALWRDKPYLQALWIEIYLGEDQSLKIGTPFLFDLGVYFVVLGVIMGVFVALREDS